MLANIKFFLRRTHYNSLIHCFCRVNIDLNEILAEPLKFAQKIDKTGKIQFEPIMLRLKNQVQHQPVKRGTEVLLWSRGTVN
jgi:hypothetical protein